MKIVYIETLISKGSFPETPIWKEIHNKIKEGIESVDWPRGSGKFSIYPESGKQRNEGNGVKPIKDVLINRLKLSGWVAEKPLDIASNNRPGKLDAVLQIAEGNIAIEWETGNISSSHRALNKMCLGLLKNVLIAGVLVVPSRELYQYLTDRVGNWNELKPYIDLWKNFNCQNGILEIIVIEQDEINKNVPRIPKGTDGRSLN